LIEQAHKEGLKVHAWFEFGFSFAYNDPESIWIKNPLNLFNIFTSFWQYCLSFPCILF